MDNANLIIPMLAVEIERIFNDRKLKTKVSELSLKTVAGQDNVNELIDLVKDLTVTEAIGLLYGLDDQIKYTLKNENKDRKLETVKVELL